MILAWMSGCGDFDLTEVLHEDVSSLEVISTDFRAKSAVTVHVIYLIASDQDDPPPENYATVADMVEDAQTYFAETLANNGYGLRTFNVPRTPEGDVDIQIITLPKTISECQSMEYMWEFDQELTSVSSHGKHPNSMAIYFVGFSYGPNIPEGYGVSHESAVNFRFKPWHEDDGVAEWSELTLWHEMGHMFGLRHDWRNGDFIMSYGYKNNPHFSPGAAGWLAHHPAFNSLNSPIDNERFMWGYNAVVVMDLTSLRFSVRGNRRALRGEFIDKTRFYSYAMLVDVTSSSNNDRNVLAFDNLDVELHDDSVIYHMDFDGEIPESTTTLQIIFTGTNRYQGMTKPIHYEVIK